MRHTRGVTALSALAAGALALTVLPSIAGAVTAETPAETAADTRTHTLDAEAERAAEALPAEALRALRRDLGLTPDEARERVAGEYRAAKTAPAIREDLAADWAGAWVSGTDATLVVATTDRAAADAITAAGAKAKIVEHSMAELEAAKKNLDRAARQLSPTAAPLWYVDVRSNSVVVHAADPAKARSLVEAGGVDSGLVKVVRSAEQPRPYADLRGGDAYYINQSSRCSVGFPVTGGDRQGFVTAGHCGVPGDPTAGHDRADQGSFEGSSFPGNDYGWVATNSNWTATPFVKGENGDVTVTGSEEAPVGSTVCRSGSTTGWHCGTIEQYDVTVQYGQGDVSGLTRTTVCAEPGDSGGPYVSGDQAQGVTSGGSGNCSIGGTTYFQPVNPILEEYGLTLVTG
ncbi:serine protease [Streptomyces carminius]|uniref:Serine protease n=1 Tax=Streptomyces carminius TaxID=2665496 RepID=A0A2M8LP14_9ACTN|nr:S1 family peptidase [Streptomyces carminius]PJE93699.1 serine protease [Streptomyces carminius]